jgi:alkanesulfonate monooxygenase
VDQVLPRIEDNQRTGIRAFIFPSYPHLDEGDHFGAKLLPHIKTCSLTHAYGSMPPDTLPTPLGTGARRRWSV